MDYAQQQRDPTRHLVGLGFVLLFHAVLVYALTTGLARTVVDVIKKPIETRIVEEHKQPKQPEAPPPPPPKLAVPPPVFVPLPEVQIAVATPVAAIAAVTTTRPAPPQAEHMPLRVAPQIDVAHNCSKPEYPSASRRAEEEGIVNLKFLVDVDGQAIRGEVVKSSGYKRLDSAALAALGLCRFRPGMVDGKPEQAVALVRYVWRIEN